MISACAEPRFARTIAQKRGGGNFFGVRNFGCRIAGGRKRLESKHRDSKHGKFDSFSLEPSDAARSCKRSFLDEDCGRDLAGLGHQGIELGGGQLPGICAGGRVAMWVGLE
jgi:hypothetical protein